MLMNHPEPYLATALLQAALQSRNKNGSWMSFSKKLIIHHDPSDSLSRENIIHHTRWCPPVISWFIIPNNYRYINYKPQLLELRSPTQLTNWAPPCIKVVDPKGQGQGATTPFSTIGQSGTAADHGKSASIPKAAAKRHHGFCSSEEAAPNLLNLCGGRERSKSLSDSILLVGL